MQPAAPANVSPRHRLLFPKEDVAPAHEGLLRVLGAARGHGPDPIAPGIVDGFFFLAQAILQTTAKRGELVVHVDNDGDAPLSEQVEDIADAFVFIHQTMALMVWLCKMMEKLLQLEVLILILIKKLFS